MSFRNAAPAVLISVLLSGSLVAAQGVPPQVLSGSFPFSACRAVAADGATGTVVMSAGGGLYVLDGTVGQVAPANVLNDRLKTQGFVRDMAMTGDTLFVAAGIEGLQAYDRVDYGSISTLKFDTNAPQVEAFALDVVTVSSVPPRTFALVGTHEGPGFSEGRLYLVDVTLPAEPTSLHSVDLGASVHSVAATTSLVPGWISVFVGTE